MIVEYMAECPHCGQIVAINGDAGMSLVEQRELAGRKCTCPGAVQARTLREMEDKLRMVCGEDSVENGFDYPIPADTIDLIRSAALGVIDELAKIVTFDACGNVITVSGNRNSVKIKRVQKKQMEI